MDRPSRRPNRVPHYDYSQAGAYFVTVCTQDRKMLLSRISHPDRPELSPRGCVAEKYIHQMDAFYDHLSVDKYVIMPDHIHLLITIHETADPIPKERTSAIARFVATFKRFCNKEFGGNIWQERYYDHVIRNQEDYNEVWEYIDDNPRKWFIQKRGYE